MESTLLTKRQTTSLSVAAAVAALLLAVVLLVMQMGQIFSVDDFFYALYWRDGLSGFLEKNVKHYQVMNGRTLVHVVAETVLAFHSEEFCAVAGTVFLLAAAFLARRGMRAGAMSNAAAFSLPVLALLLLLAPEMLREALLWTSAFYNYAFPMVLLMAQLWALDRWLERGGWRLGLACALLSFLTGATTELYGIMAVIMALAAALARLIQTRKKWGRMFLATACTAAGLMTVLNSPATQGRVEREVAAGQDFWAVYLGRLEYVAKLLFGPQGDAALALTILFSATCLLGLLSKRRRPLALWGAAAVILRLIPGTEERFWFAVAAAAALALVLLCMRGMEGAGALLAAGGCAVLAICATGSVAPRTVFPFLFSVGLVACRLWAELLAALEERAEEHPRGESLLGACGAATLLLTAVVLMAYLPTWNGVAANTALDRANRAAAREAAETGGDFFYNIDYDRRYCHIGMYEFAMSYEGYLYYWGLDSSQLWFTSDVTPCVVVEGQRIRTLSGGAPKEDGSPALLPVGEVFSTLGGAAFWWDGSLRMVLDDRVCLWKNSRYQFTDKWGYQVEYVAYSEEITAFSMMHPDVLRNVFGIHTEYDADANCYRLTYVPEDAAGMVLDDPAGVAWIEKN